jgi:hypothetical protein
MSASYVQRIAGSRAAGSRAAQSVVRPPRSLFAVRGDSAVAGAPMRSTRDVFRRAHGSDASVRSGSRSLLSNSDNAYGTMEQGLTSATVPARVPSEGDHPSRRPSRHTVPATIVQNVYAAATRATSPAHGPTMMRPTERSAGVASVASANDAQRHQARNASSPTPSQTRVEATSAGGVRDRIEPAVTASAAVLSAPSEHAAVPRLSAREPHAVVLLRPQQELASTPAPERTSQLLIPTPPANLDVPAPPTRASRNESPSIHIGTVEVKMSSPERRPARASSSAPASSLARGTFTPFGLRQG